MFAEIALDLPLYSFYTYSVPEHLRSQAEPGKRAVVSFGKRILTGLIVSLRDSAGVENVKPLKFITDREPVIGNELMSFCKWISSYYIAPPGEVLFSCVPRKAAISSAVKYGLSENAKSIFETSKFRSRIYGEIFTVLMQSADNPLSAKQIERRSGLSNLKSYLDNLKAKGIINEIESIRRPTVEKHVLIVSAGENFEQHGKIIEENKLRSPKYVQAVHFVQEKGVAEETEVREASGLTSAQLRRLELLGVLHLRDQRQMREHKSHFDEPGKQIVLNEHQKTALEEISASVDLGSFRTYLLHGVTGSGKTEVYIKVASRCVESGKTAIILVPEISLTPQLLHRFKSVFGQKVAAIHSKLTEGERLDTFDRIISGEVCVVVGARSALFAPLKNLGLLVVDEEHDSSYKQDTSPRYNGRDAAVYRASMANAVAILGSATPSVESYYNAETGKYKLLTLPERVSESDLPEIRVVDLSDRELPETDEEEKDILDKITKTRVRFLSKEMILEIGKRLTHKENVIILQNRRGYHSYLECRACGNVEMCENCSIALAYHKSFGELRCHYCGYSRAYTGTCSKCLSASVTPKGAGTERVEEELKKLFAGAVIVRLDSDSLTSRSKYEKILRDFYEGKIDILTGTQIISKGLDFPNVTLVGVINADIGLLNPDFRATEKTFQILTQVSGRSGRSSKRGEVLIQTNHADYFVFSAVKNHDYKGFYSREIKLRKELQYPPFSRIALIEIKSANLGYAAELARKFFDLLKSYDKRGILKIFPPVQPLFAKLNNRHRFHIMLRSPKDKDASGSYMASVLRSARKDPAARHHDAEVSIDVDAVNLM